MSTLECQSVAMQFVRVSDLATIVMNEHINDHDLCVVCGGASPCQRVVLTTAAQLRALTPLI